jgi:ZIP family zinc transporter
MIHANAAYDVPGALLLTTLCGLSTVLGALALFAWRGSGQHRDGGRRARGDDTTREARLEGFAMGVGAGAMLYVALIDMMYPASVYLGVATARAWFFAGLVGFEALLYTLTNLVDLIPTGGSDKRTAWVSWLAMVVHNLPEGVAVFMATLTGVSYSAQLVIGVATHNMCEGVSIAMSTVRATGSRTRAVWACVTSGLYEPLGALILLVPWVPEASLRVVEQSMALAAGIMTTAVLGELYPNALRLTGVRSSMRGVILGMLTVWAAAFVTGATRHDYTAHHQ